MEKRNLKKAIIISKGEGLDFVEAAHADRVYPLMYCHLKLTGHLDVARLKEAVGLSAQVVPELLCAYDFKRGCFTEQGHAPENVVSVGASACCNLSAWDLSQGPQLQILLCHGDNGDDVTVGMSHILSDGEGFKQYLYLLAALYNGWRPSGPLHNRRNIAPILKGIRMGRPTQQTKYGTRVSNSPLRQLQGDTKPYCLHTEIGPDAMEAIRTKARANCATFNDTIMTAFALVIAQIQKVERVVFPCPADLRKFASMSECLTVANMTGLYRRVTVEIPANHSFSSTLLQVHLEMNIQKAHCRCFSGILPLSHAFRKIPRPILREIIKASYRLMPISFTNVGVIDHEKLAFKSCPVSTCYLTGTYRRSPDFQLTVSTFRDTCSLNCALLGDEEDRQIGESILEKVKKQLLYWTNT